MSALGMNCDKTLYGVSIDLGYWFWTICQLHYYRTGLPTNYLYLLQETWHVSSPFITTGPGTGSASPGVIKLLNWSNPFFVDCCNYRAIQIYVYFALLVVCFHRCAKRTSGVKKSKWWDIVAFDMLMTVVDWFRLCVWVLIRCGTMFLHSSAIRCPSFIFNSVLNAFTSCETIHSSNMKMAVLCIFLCSAEYGCYHWSCVIYINIWSELLSCIGLILKVQMWKAACRVRHVSNKTNDLIFYHDFSKCKPIFRIPLLRGS